MQVLEQRWTLDDREQSLEVEELVTRLGEGGGRDTSFRGQNMFQASFFSS